MTDSKSLFDIFTKGTGTKERWLLIDLQSVRDAHALFEVNNLSLVISDHKIATALTKMMRKQF